MVRTTFKVQVDRVRADADSEATEAWLAIKLSAEFLENEAPPLDGNTHRLLLPWHWSGVGEDGIQRAWNPRSRFAWQIWRLDSGGPTLVPINRAVFCSADVDPPHAIYPSAEQKDFQTKLDKAADAIALEAGGTSRLGSLTLPAPGSEADVRGTVPGFVERLASMPHPVPGASAVHALLAVDRPDIADDDAFFVAAPRLWIDGALCDPGTAAPGQRPDSVWQFDSDPRTLVLCQPSLPKSRLVHDARSGRLINLFDQLVAVQADPAQSLPSADRVAALPQALADAMDPLSRITSLLPRAFAAWLPADSESDPEHRREILEKDLTGDRSSLAIALEIIGLQVLGPIYDAVGRFDIPLDHELRRIAPDNVDTARLLKTHLEHLPADEPGMTISVAERVQQKDLSKPFGAFSLFAPDVLRAIAGFSPEASTALRDPVECLKEFWTTPGPQQQGTARGFRELALAPRDQAHQGDTIRIAVSFRPADMLEDPGSEPYSSASAVNGVAFGPVRQSASLAFAAPFIEGLVSGRTDWGVVDAAGSTVPLWKRFSTSMRALLLNDDPVAGPNGLYVTLTDDAGTAADCPAELKLFLKSLMQLGGEEAVKLARRLGSTSDPYDRITPLPLPLTLQVDQFRTFSRHLDDWTRLAGYGLVLGREAKDGSVRPISLNRSTLALGGRTPSKQPGRETGRIGEGQEIAADGFLVKSVGGDRALRAFVDPNPYPLSDQVGVSDAVAEYANAWIAAPMPGEGLAHGVTSVGVVAAQFLSGAPQAAGDLPALSFGYVYWGFGHLPLNGSVLAPCLRAAGNPYLIDLGVSELPLVKFPKYLRTVGIGTPSISAETRSAPPANLELLADELPKRRPPLCPGKAGIRINVDHDNGETIVDWPASSPAVFTGLRFEWVLSSDKQASVALSVSPDTRSESFPISEIPLDAGTAECWFRLDVPRDGNIMLYRAESGSRAEAELEPGFWDRVSFDLGHNRWDGDGVFLTLQPVEPGPLIEVVRTVGIRKKKGKIEEIVSAAMMEKRLAPAATILLDGLESASNRSVPSKSILTITGPQTSRMTWERWTNVALFSQEMHDTPVQKTVINTLNRLQGEKPAGETGSTAGMMPDPAVSGLLVELWSVFPERREAGHFLQPASPTALTAPTVRVAIEAVDSAAKPGLLAKGGLLHASCPAGQVLELRVRAAIKPDARGFGGFVADGERLGPALIETLSEFETGGERWLVGPAAVQPIEVAVDYALRRSDPTWKSQKALRPRCENGQRFADLTFQPGLFGKGGRQALRYFASASLLPQRWTWLGHPRMPKPQSWLGRKDDDIGLVATGKITAGHAIGVEPLLSKATSIAVVSRGLGWRGGWNRWRFGVRLTSRYAPLFASTARARVDLHRHDDWLELDAYDADNGREVNKPSLVLILPLTEQTMDEGIVPPVMAIFKGGMHQNDHFGDQLAASVEVVRHPYPFTERAHDRIVELPLKKERDELRGLTDALSAKKAALESSDDLPKSDPGKLSEEARALKVAEIAAQEHDVAVAEANVKRLETELPKEAAAAVDKEIKDNPIAAFKYLSEYGFDPVRDGSTPDGSAVALRIEGPIGYGFDRGAKAGRFDHAGFLIIPAQANLKPFSMLKIKFRRVEDPEGLEAKSINAPANGSWPIAGHWQEPKEGSASDLPIVHEGLVFTKSLSRETDSAITWSFGFPAANPGKDGAGRVVHLEVKWVGQRLEVKASVLSHGQAVPIHPNAATWALDDVGSSVELRVIVAQDPQPQQGKVYRPSGDITVEIRLGEATYSDLSGYPWTTLFSVPIVAQGEIDVGTGGKIALVGAMDHLGPIRLSAYTTATWCQVTIASSRFEVMPATAYGKPGSGWRSTNVDDLTLRRLKKGHNWSDLYLADAQSYQPLVFRPGVEDPHSDIEEVCVAVLAIAARDIFGRLKERQVLAARVDTVAEDGGQVSRLGRVLWHADADLPDAGNYQSGRVRFIRAVIRRGRELESLDALYDEQPGSPIAMNPADARGNTLTLSQPTLWGF